MNQINLKELHFSLKEIKKSGLNVKLLRFNNINVDIRRKSEKPANVEILKKLKLEPLPKSGKKKPKKKTPQKSSKIEKEIKEQEIVPEETPATEDKPKTTQKGLKITKLEDLEGMEPRFLKKLSDLGIDTPDKLMDEDFKELAKLIRSTQKLIKSWRAQISGEE